MKIKFVQQRNNIVIDSEILDGKDKTDVVIYSETSDKWVRYKNKTLAELTVFNSTIPVDPVT